MVAERARHARPASLALRLTLLFGVLTAVVFAGFGWLIEDSIQRHFAGEDTSELRSVVAAVERVLDDRTHPPDPRRFADILVGHHGTSLWVGQDGRTRYASPGPDLTLLVEALPETGHVLSRTLDGHRYRVLLQRRMVSGRRYTIIAAVPIDYHRRFLHGFRATLWSMIASGIVLVSLMGWLAVRQGHAPLRDVVQRIRRISADDLDLRLAPAVLPRELQDLAVAFNEMLDRVAAAFVRLSNVSADVAHELRTPITNMMTQTQVALAQERSPSEYREILYSNMEEFENLTQMINDMLFLARTDSVRALASEPIDLAQAVADLFEYYGLLAEEAGVALAVEGAAEVCGDRAMLRRAIGNLLSNAIRHTPEGGTVRVRLTRQEDGIRIEVANPGKPVPAEHLPHLFERFYRVDPARRGGGAGLGLAIVKSIVEAHGGSMTVTSTVQATRFVIALPAR